MKAENIKFDNHTDLIYNMGMVVKKKVIFMGNIEKIKELVQNNNGILLVKEVQKNDIHRQYIKQLEETGYLRKVSKGVYVEKEKEINEFFILGQKYKKGIFSHNTALYFYNLTDRTPIKIDMTFPSYITVHDRSIKIHYVQEEKHNLGLKIMRLQDGTTIQIYDMERTICDIIRDRNKIDPQIFNDAIKGYIKKKEKNLILLYEYAEKFKIQNILKNYMEVL